MKKLVIVSLISFLLFGCSENIKKSSILTEDSIREILRETFDARQGWKWNSEDTPTGSKSTLEYVTVPGELTITDVRLSDTKSKILLIGAYRHEETYIKIRGVLERNEFGIYNGTINLPEGLSMSLEVREP